MGDDNVKKYEARCWKCKSIGHYERPEDAANAETQHQINNHPVQLQGNTGNASTAGWKTEKYGVTGKLKRNKDEPKKKGK
jgi:hypothetical protein